MMLPGVAREKRVPFTAELVKLLLKKGFQEEFAEEAYAVAALMDNVLKKAEEPTENPEGAACRKAG